MKDYIEAHKFSCNHMDALKQDSVCGCFHCGKIFSPSQITRWILGDNPGDRLGTAICPHCGVDAVIGESSGYPITEAFLAEMNRHWFSATKTLVKDPLRMQQYRPSFLPLMEALWDYATDDLSWEQLQALLAQKQTAPAFGVTLGSSGWLQYSSPESVYSSEFALLAQVLRLDAEGAKQAIRAFFQTEPELTPARIYILADRNSWTCPPFLQFMIGPLYGYWLGKVPYQGVMIRLNDAREAWQSHEYRTVLEENYQPEYELMNTLIQASQQTTSGDPESEAAFQQTLLSALERYAITPVQRTQQLRY